MNKFLTKAKSFRIGRAVKVVPSSKHAAAVARPSTLFLRFSVKEQMLFAKRLSFLVKGGVPLVECLHLIRKQTKSKGKGLIYDSVIRDVSSGQYLSSSLAKFKGLFGDFAINLIRVGENSGVLSQNLAYLADELQKKHALRRKVIGALIYPMFITIATLGVTGVLTAYIFPKLMPIFTSLHVELPLTTRMLIAVSAYLRDWGIYTIFGLIAVGIVFFILRARFERLRYLTDALILKLPLVGTMMQAYNLTNFCRTLGLLLRSGLQFTESLIITAETTPNRVYRAACMRLADHVMKGEPVSRGLERRPELYPMMLVHMVAIGESTGNLSASFVYLAELYEGEVEEQTKSLSSSIEPVLMVVMGLLVGLIAVSVITPIYSITQHLQPK
jgi:type II secretory pathway component PulF